MYYTKLHINSQLGAWICQDKSLTRNILEKEAFPNIPYCYSKNVADVNSFFDVHRCIIQKPVLGMKSQDVRLISRRDEIDFGKLEESIFEAYIEGTEYRCLVSNGKVIGMQRKKLDPTPDYQWRKQITALEAHEWNRELVSLSQKIADLLQMRFIAVDFIVDEKGTAWVLELNGMPGLYSFHHPDVGRALNVAAMVLDVILRK